MQRILVMGSSGSGKSTFARRLCDLTGLPFVSLDALFWKPGWVKFFEGLRPDQTFVCFTRRAQADRYLETLAPSAALSGNC